VKLRLGAPPPPPQLPTPATHSFQCLQLRNFGKSGSLVNALSAAPYVSQHLRQTVNFPTGKGQGCPSHPIVTPRFTNHPLPACIFVYIILTVPLRQASKVIIYFAPGSTPGMFCSFDLRGNATGTPPVSQEIQKPLISRRWTLRTTSSQCSPCIFSAPSHL